LSKTEGVEKLAFRGTPNALRRTLMTEEDG